MHLELGGVKFKLDVPGVALGLVVARGCQVGPSPDALSASVDAAVATAKARPAEWVETRAKQIRELLRHGKYKPTGRGKPACEYLLAAAKEGRFPRINNLVDACNWISLEHLLPISLIDLDRAASSELLVRHGRAGERYVFNAAGQEIELEDLLLVAVGTDDRATANPIKDSMATKLNDESRAVAAVIYAPPARAADATAAAEALARALSAYGGSGRAHHGRLATV